jgi:hypothetical protein
MTRDDYQAYIDAFMRGDFEGFTRYYAPDVRLSLAGGQVVLEGPDEIAGFYRNVFKRIRESLEILTFVSDEETLAAEVKTEFTALEDYPDFTVRPMRKGESARIVSFVFYRLRDGKFTDIRGCRYGMW